MWGGLQPARDFSPASSVITPIRPLMITQNPANGVCALPSPNRHLILHAGERVKASLRLASRGLDPFSSIQLALRHRRDNGPGRQDDLPRLSKSKSPAFA